jgi:bifunctional DNA-binding transcriptional regulator/antitoxin component of YhaV-PrlF toxin-antitoxin module
MKVIFMDIAITRMSSKGQIVIPVEMRAEFPKGEKLVILSTGETLHIKKASKMRKNVLEDIEFTKRTDAAWKRYETNPKSFKQMSFEAFLEEIKKW